MYLFCIEFLIERFLKLFKSKTPLPLGFLSFFFFKFLLWTNFLVFFLLQLCYDILFRLLFLFVFNFLQHYNSVSWAGFSLNIFCFSSKMFFESLLDVFLWYDKILSNYFSIWASQVVLVVKNSSANAGDARDGGSIPWARKIQWRAWIPVPILLPGESHGQRSLAGYSP